MIYLIGITASYIYAQYLGTMLWWEWITIPVIIIFCSILERFLQKEVMHQRVNNRGLIAFYKHHTLNHHRLFTDQEMRFRYHKDGHVTVFPPYAVVIFILMDIIS